MAHVHNNNSVKGYAKGAEMMLAAYLRTPTDHAAAELDAALKNYRKVFIEIAAMIPARVANGNKPVQTTPFVEVRHPAMRRPLIDFESPCPNRYDTVTAFCRRYDIPRSDADQRRDGSALTASLRGVFIQRKFGGRTIKVLAPKVVREIGFNTVNAYPVRALIDHYRRRGYERKDWDSLSQFMRDRAESAQRRV